MSENDRAWKDSPLKIRLFTAEDAAAAAADPNSTDRLSPQMTLVEFFDAYVLPNCLATAKPRTTEQYRESLRYWKRFTGDPPLDLVDDETVAAFLAKLQELPGRDGQPIADNTIRKHCVALQSCLDRAGPKSRGRKGRKNKGLIAEPPLLEKPPVVISDVDDNFSLVEIGQWLDACHAAIKPNILGVRPCDWWRALILFGYNVGLRIETLLKIQYDWITVNELGKWVQVPPHAIKRKHGRAFYLNPWALAAIEAIRTKRERIFEWPFKTQGWLHMNRRRILKASKIEPARHFGFHSLRKAFGTELGKINGLAAEMGLGHAAGNVTRDHYTHKSVMVEAMNKLPQPIWDGADDRDGPQMRLF